MNAYTSFPSQPIAGPSRPSSISSPCSPPSLSRYGDAPAPSHPRTGGAEAPGPNASLAFREAGGGGGGGTLGREPFIRPHQDLDGFLSGFWTRHMDICEREEADGRSASLPLARIKKVMKSDEEVKMISAEVPIMFSKACEIFISELTCRAWLVAEQHKRRTLQKSDVAAAIAYSDMFDFLIDIVPRDEPDGATNNGAAGGEGGEGEGGGGGGGSAGSGRVDGSGSGEGQVVGESRSGSADGETGMNGEDGGVVGMRGQDALKDPEGGEYGDEDLYDEFMQRDA